MSRKIIFNKQQTENIIKRYTVDKKTIEFIAKEINVGRRVISRTLKENNIQVINGANDRRINTGGRVNFFNQDYFENIDTQNKAYWLGFMYADGNVYISKSKVSGGTKGGTVELTLKDEDGYHLVNLKNCIKGNMKIESREVRLNDNIYYAKRISMNSIKMSKDLIDKGCVQNKSLILQFPVKVPDDLLRHFIRGYIDGDGCVFIKECDDTNFVFRVEVLGTFEFLKGLKIFLEKNNIATNTIREHGKTRAFDLKMYGRENLARLFIFLYEDCTMYLSRKFEKFIQGTSKSKISDELFSEVSRIADIVDKM